MYYGGKPEHIDFATTLNYATLPYSPGDIDVVHYCTKARDLRIASGFQIVLNYV